MSVADLAAYRSRAGRCAHTWVATLLKPVHERCLRCGVPRAPRWNLSGADPLTDGIARPAPVVVA